MGLSGWLAGRALRASQVLVVECPGAWGERVAAERAVVARGWRLAESPASADVLLVVGDATGELAEVVARVWDALPGPRARVEVPADGDLTRALDAAALRLADTPAQARDAGSRRDPDLSGGDGGHEGMDHGGHEGMDHGDMEMAPGGIPLAEGSEDDRDGLEMDEVPVRLGPVLPGWPPGLVLDVTLHGDLVAAATADSVAPGVSGARQARVDPAARACDDVATVLRLAGWADGATSARVVRDAFLDGLDEAAAAGLADLRRRVSRSRLLRWSLRGVGVVGAEQARELGLPDHVMGDCLGRLHGLLDRAGSETDPVPAGAVGRLVIGCDLAVARLVVATLGTPVVPAGVSAHG